MKIDIDQLTEAELRELNGRIVERIRFLVQMRAHVAMLKFTIGDRVSFQPSDRPRVNGTLVKYNKKSVTVISDEGEKWQVGPGLLFKPEIDITPKPEGVKTFQLGKK